MQSRFFEFSAFLSCPCLSCFDLNGTYADNTPNKLAELAKRRSTQMQNAPCSLDVLVAEPLNSSIDMLDGYQDDVLDEMEVEKPEQPAVPSKGGLSGKLKSLVDAKTGSNPRSDLNLAFFFF